MDHDFNQHVARGGCLAENVGSRSHEGVPDVDEKQLTHREVDEKSIIFRSHHRGAAAVQRALGRIFAGRPTEHTPDLENDLRKLLADCTLVDDAIARLDAEYKKTREKAAHITELRAQLGDRRRCEPLEPRRMVARQASGLLIDAYLAALAANPDGLTSREVREWIDENMQDVNPQSIQAVMSRARQLGMLSRDRYGVYRLTDTGMAAAWEKGLG